MLKIDTARHHRHLPARDPKQREFTYLISCGGHNAFRRPGHRHLHSDPVEWTRVRWALIAPLD